MPLAAYRTARLPYQDGRPSQDSRPDWGDLPDRGDLPYRDSLSYQDGVLVLRDATGAYFALPSLALAPYRVPDEQLAELARDLATAPLALPAAGHYTGVAVRTAVHVRRPGGGRW